MTPLEQSRGPSVEQVEPRDCLRDRLRIMAVVMRSVVAPAVLGRSALGTYVGLDLSVSLFVLWLSLFQARNLYYSE